MSDFDADLIIAGAGCAGLSALWHALDGAAAGRRIVVIDREISIRDRVTWSFWGPDTLPFAPLADRSWNRLAVRFPGWETVGELRGPAAGPRRRYHRVRQRHFDAAVLDRAHASPDVRFVEQDIAGIRDEPSGAVVELPEGELRAPLVLQSALPPATIRRPRHPLRQHFAGLEVRTEHAVFDPGVATLMDFDTDQLDAVTFFYVLPDAPDRALVEHTMFSLDPRPPSFHEQRVRDHLDRLGAGDVTVERREHGAIPMEDRPIDQRRGRHVWNLGSAGGMTKPTTGYTFQRIQAQTRHLVDAWARGAPLEPLPAPPSRYRFADHTLLNILHRRPELGRPIFERLFRTNEIDDVLTFLDEQSTVRRDARMIGRLPWLPFVRAGVDELAHDLTTRTGHPGHSTPCDRC